MYRLGLPTDAPRARHRRHHSRPRQSRPPSRRARCGPLYRRLRAANRFLGRARKPHSRNLGRAGGREIRQGRARDGCARDKMAAEVLSRDYAGEHELSVSIARLGTLYGPVEGEVRIARNLPPRGASWSSPLEKPTVRVFGLATKRPYSFIDDAARVLVDLALTRLDGGDTFHVGSEESVAFSHLLDAVARLRPEVRFEPVKSIADADLSMTPKDRAPGSRRSASRVGARPDCLALGRRGPRGSSWIGRQGWDDDLRTASPWLDSPQGCFRPRGLGLRAQT